MAPEIQKSGNFHMYPIGTGCWGRDLLLTGWYRLAVVVIVFVPDTFGDLGGLGGLGGLSSRLVAGFPKALVILDTLMTGVLRFFRMLGASEFSTDESFCFLDAMMAVKMIKVRTIAPKRPNMAKIVVSGLV